MSSRKRKNPIPSKDGSDASRAERKRIQNRISQKCHRERQAAHARHLESVVDIIKTTDQEGDNTNDRYAALLRQHMKVIEEKRELEEAVFRMRKKLLSISNSAAAAADDEAVDTLVNSKNRTRRQSEPDSTPTLLPTSQHVDTINMESPDNVKVLSSTEIEKRQNITIEQPSVAVSSQEPQLLGLEHNHDMCAPTKGSMLPMINWTSDSEQPDALVGISSGQLTPQIQSYAWSFGALELTFPLDHPYSLPPPAKTITITSVTTFADSLLHACKKYVDLQTSDLDDEITISHDLVAYGRPEEGQDTNHVAQISAIGVHILAAFAGLELYIYGVGAACPMESIIRWRLVPTFASRAAIPEPFRPTPLQYSTNDYPLPIDFINWPAIRDQLILQSKTINFDELIPALVQNTVVEIPHRHMSVNVLSLFYSSIANPSNQLTWNNNPKTAITDSQWKFLEIPAPPELDFDSSNADTTPAESALVQEISRRMDSSSNASSPEENGQPNAAHTIGTPRGVSLSATSDSLTGSWNAATHRRNDVVAHFGLDQVAKWKLSKEFARKYPFLDCSSAVTTYDMVSAQVALETETRVC